MASFSFGAKLFTSISTLKEYFSVFTAIVCEVVIILLDLLCMDIMASSGQKKGGCGHIMASFDTHIRCAHC